LSVFTRGSFICFLKIDGVLTLGSKTSINKKITEDRKNIDMPATIMVSNVFLDSGPMAGWPMPV